MPANTFSLYVHIPFCKVRCSYCAFNTYTGLEALYEPFLQALRREIRLVGTASPGLTSHSLYFGGGTPSVLSPLQVQSVIATCRGHLGLISDAEISLEANPGTITLNQLRGYREAGVTRLSLGVQSAREADLRLFGRDHTFEEAEEAFRLARAAGFESISVDLIYGAPHQTYRGWHQVLDAVLAWEPDHISLYSLALEPGTALHHRVEHGLLPHPDSNLVADMYEGARDALGRAGLQQYEISNWARPGHECQHNRQYWLNLPYLAFGPGAHGWAGHLRYWNVNPVPGYINCINDGDTQPFPFSPAVDDYEVIPQEMEMAETVILGLRLVREGVSKADFARRFGQSLDSVFGPAIGGLEQAGLLRLDGDTLRLTEKAYFVSNRVFVEFLPEPA